MPDFDPQPYLDNISGAIGAYKTAGTPADDQLRTAVQQNYDKLNSNGYFASPDGQQVGHVLRAQSLATDPTQGNPSPPSNTMTVPGSGNITITGPTVQGDGTLAPNDELAHVNALANQYQAQAEAHVKAGQPVPGGLAATIAGLNNRIVQLQRGINTQGQPINNGEGAQVQSTWTGAASDAANASVEQSLRNSVTGLGNDVLTMGEAGSPVLNPTKAQYESATNNPIVGPVLNPIGNVATQVKAGAESLNPANMGTTQGKLNALATVATIGLLGHGIAEGVANHAVGIGRTPIEEDAVPPPSPGAKAIPGVGENVRSQLAAVKPMRAAPAPPLEPIATSPVHDFIRANPGVTPEAITAQFPHIDTATAQQAIADVRGSQATPQATESAPTPDAPNTSPAPSVTPQLPAPAAARSAEWQTKFGLPADQANAEASVFHTIAEAQAAAQPNLFPTVQTFYDQHPVNVADGRMVSPVTSEPVAPKVDSTPPSSNASSEPAAPVEPLAPIPTPVQPGDYVQSKIDPTQFGRVESVGETAGAPAYKISTDGGKTTSLIAGDVNHVPAAELPQFAKDDMPHSTDTAPVQGETAVSANTAPSEFADVRDALRGTLNQGVKGSYQPASNLITAFKNADISTVLHEGFHSFVNTMHPEDTNLHALEDYIGRKRDAWTTADHEHLARQWERYFYDGQAPNSRVAAAFAVIKAAMLKVYKNLSTSAIKNPVHPNLRPIFDSIIGKDAEGAKEVPQATESAAGGKGESTGAGEAKPPTDGKYAGSINTKLLRGDPEAMKEVHDTAQRLGLTNKGPVTHEQIHGLARSLNLSMADFHSLDPGEFPHRPDGVPQNVWHATWVDAIRMGYEHARAAQDDARRMVQLAAENAQDSPTAASQAALDRANVEYGKARADLDTMTAHNDAMANQQGLAFGIRNGVAEPSQGEGYQSALAKAPSLDESLAKPEPRGIAPRRAPAAKVRTVSSDDMSAAIQRLRESGVPKVLAQDEAPETLYQQGEHNPQEDTPEFKRFFSGSKVVDETGAPKIVYHGAHTNDQFSQFKTGKGDIGVHFGDQDQANDRLDQKMRYEGYSPNRTDGKGIKSDRVFPSYLSIKNPLRLPDVKAWHDYREVARALTNTGEFSAAEIADATRKDFNPRNPSASNLQKLIKSHGYDGVVYRNTEEARGSGQDSYIAFDPKQIKSAIGNRGTFDPTDPNILYQRDDTTNDLVTVGKGHWEEGLRGPAWRDAVEKSIGTKLTNEQAEYVRGLTKADLARDVTARQKAALQPLFVDKLGGELGIKGAGNLLESLPDDIRNRLIRGDAKESFTPADQATIQKAWEASQSPRKAPVSPRAATVAKQIAMDAKRPQKATPGVPKPPGDALDQAIIRRVKGGQVSVKAIRADLASDELGKSATEKVLDGSDLTTDEGRRIARAVDTYRRTNPRTTPAAVTAKLTKLISDARRGRLGYDNPKEAAKTQLVDQVNRVVKDMTSKANPEKLAAAQAKANAKIEQIGRDIDPLDDHDYKGIARVLVKHSGLDEQYHQYILGNLLSGWDILEKILGGHVSTVAGEELRRAIFSPGGTRTGVGAGLSAAAKTGLPEAGTILKEGSTVSHLQGKSPFSEPGDRIPAELRGKLGVGHRAFLRLHGAIYHVLNTYNFERGLHIEAIKDGKAKGLTGDDLDNHVIDVRLHPEQYPKLLENAKEFMREETQTNENLLSKGATSLAKLIDAKTHSKAGSVIKSFALPVARVPLNAAGRAIESMTGLVSAPALAHIYDRLHPEASPEMVKEYRNKVFQRGAVGAGIAAVGAIANLLGGIIAPDDKHGRYVGQINLPGGRSIDVPAGNVGGLLDLGSSFTHTATTQGLGKAITNTPQVMAKALLNDNPLMRTIAAADAVGSKITGQSSNNPIEQNSQNRGVGNIITQHLPLSGATTNLAADLDVAHGGGVRQKNSPLDYVANAEPVAREKFLKLTNDKMTGRPYPQQILHTVPTIPPALLARQDAANIKAENHVPGTKRAAGLGLHLRL